MADGLHRMPCPSCGRRIKFGEEDAGTEAFCPHCDTPVVLQIEDGPPVVDAPAPPPPPVAAGPNKGMLIAIPVSIFVVVFGLITVAAVIMKKGRSAKVEQVDPESGEVVEVEEDDAGPARAASPKVQRLANYKRPLNLEKKEKITFDNPTPRKGGDATQLLGHKVIKAELGSMQYVVGLLTNHTSKRFFDVYAHFDLYNDKNKKVGEAEDYLGILSPNGSWEIKATIFVRGATSAKLRKIDKDPE